jgi:hypothetical protein
MYRIKMRRRWKRGGENRGILAEICIVSSVNLEYNGLVERFCKIRSEFFAKEVKQ